MAEGAAEACICVLFYGADDSYFKLAKRVLNEPMRCLAGRNIEFRFGCNAVGAETSSFLSGQIAEHFRDALVVNKPENIMKYPMMRHMFHDKRISAPVTIWFDHDSCIAPSANANRWLDRVLRQLAGCDMVGSIYRSKLSDAQVDWVKQQSWFTGQPGGPYVQHALGGWWAIRTELLYQFNWPDRTLKQKDGDVIIGELFRQQGLLVSHFRDDVKINVNDAGVEAAAARTITV
jgi:hypothetical protein